MEQEILATAQALWGVKDNQGIALKLAEEAGEVCGAAVKIPEGRATQKDMDDEAGDCLIVLAQYAALRGTTIEILLTQRWTHILQRNQKS